MLRSSQGPLFGKARFIIDQTETKEVSTLVALLDSHVYFDRKLLYNHHVTKMAVKAENGVACISMLANTVQGLSHFHLHLFSTIHAFSLLLPMLVLPGGQANRNIFKY